MVMDFVRSYPPGPIGDVSCLSYNAGIQSIPHGVITALTMDSDSFFTVDGIHSTSVNSSRHTVPPGQAGLWQCTVRAHGATFAASQAGIILYKNGIAGTRLAADFRPGTATVNNIVECTAFVRMEDGEYFEAAIFQNSGSSRNYNGWTDTPNSGTSMFSRRIA